MMMEMPVNESNIYHDLARKIGNISMINGGNAVSSSVNLNNNSHIEIDEMLLKIIFDEDKKPSSTSIN